MLRRYSLAQISAELGVSKAAVSLALNGKARSVGVSAELEQRILAFCRKVHYQPNIHARRLNSKLVHNIGVMLERPDLPGQLILGGATSNIFDGITKAADSAGFRVTIQLYRPDQADSVAFNWLLNREIDGLIFYGLQLPEHWRKRFIAEQWPIIGIGIAPGHGVPAVNSNNFEATLSLTRALLAHGYRDFHYLAGLPVSYPAQERERGIRTALAEAGIELEESRIHCFSFEQSVSYKTVGALLREGRLSPGVAVVAATEILAIGAIRAIQDAGFRVPEDYAVTGVNSFFGDSYFRPRLSTFEYLPCEQGAKAVELLLAALAGTPPPESTVIEGKLIPGDSAPVAP